MICNWVKGRFIKEIRALQYFLFISDPWTRNNCCILYFLFPVSCVSVFNFFFCSTTTGVFTCLFFISLHRTTSLWMGGLLGCIDQKWILIYFCQFLFYYFILFYFIYFIPYKLYALSTLTVMLKIFVVPGRIDTAQILYPKNFNCNACESLVILFTSNNIRIYVPLV